MNSVKSKLSPKAKTTEEGTVSVNERNF